MNTQLIKLAVVDDHQLVREMLVNYINSLEGMQTCLEAGDGAELLSKLASAAEAPDVCLLDVGMPGMNGYDTIKQLKVQWPQLRVLALSMFDTDYAVAEMLRYGARGYLLKGGTCLGEMETAIRTVHSDQYHISSFLSIHKIARLSGPSGRAVKVSSLEKAFMRHNCSSLSYEQIAREMNVSKRTVENYRDQLFHKFDLSSRNALSIFAIYNGLVDVAELAMA